MVHIFGIVGLSLNRHPIRILFLEALADAETLHQALPALDDLLLLFGTSLLLGFLLCFPVRLVWTDLSTERKRR